jgi:hypothetical protein
MRQFKFCVNSFLIFLIELKTCAISSEKRSMTIFSSRGTLMTMFVLDASVIRSILSTVSGLPLMIVAISIPAANFHRLKSYMNIHFSIVSFFSADKLSKM